MYGYELWRAHSPSGSLYRNNNYNILYIINNMIWSFDICRLYVLLETVAQCMKFLLQLKLIKVEMTHVQKKILWYWPAGNLNPGRYDYQSDALSSELLEPGYKEHFIARLLKFSCVSLLKLDQFITTLYYIHYDIFAYTYYTTIRLPVYYKVWSYYRVYN